MRVPSIKTIDLYNRLVANQNKVRKTLIRVHKNAEETSGAGRLPALVIPKSARRIKNNYFQGLSKDELKRRLKLFYAKYKESKRLFGQGLKSYLARIVKDGYLDLWKDQIDFVGGGRPEGAFGRYSKEQIENSYMGEYMEVYNLLNSLSSEVFLALLYSGRIIQFKYIYQDIISGTGEKENSWLQQQKEILEIYRSPKARKELMDSVRNIIPSSEDPYYSGKHTDSTMKSAERRYSRSRKKD